MTSSSKKLLVMGWDAADWGIIDALMAKGGMPNLRSIIAKGVRCPLKTLEPRLSPLLWSTVATGKGPDMHGILNFVEPKPDGSGIRVVQSTTRKTKALWNIFSQNHLRTHVVGWYASHPAEPINGVIVSNLLHEKVDLTQTDPHAEKLLPGTVHPAELNDIIESLIVHQHELRPEHIQQWLPRYREVPTSDDHLIKGLTQKLSYAMSVAQIGEWLLQHQDWDVSMLFFDAIDTMGHEFMSFRAPKMKHVSDKQFSLFSGVMDAVYAWHDDILGRLLSHVHDDTAIVILSDHGFHHGNNRPVTQHLSPEKRMEMEASWHRNYGIWVASGPNLQVTESAVAMSLLDVAPTLLAICGLPAGKDMPGKVISEWFAEGQIPERVETWEHQAEKDGLHPADLQTDPLQQVATLKQLIDLGYLAALPKNSAEQIDLVERESRYNLAGFLSFSKKYDQAAELYELLWKKSAQILRYGVGWAQALLASGQTEEAELAASEVLKSHPTAVELILLLATCARSKRKTTDATRLVEQAERIVGQKSDHLANVAQAWLNLGEINRASDCCRKILIKPEDDPKWMVLLSKIYLAQGSFEAAADKALDALDVSQAIPEAHFVLGAALAWLGQIEDALTCLRFALNLEPQHIEARRFVEIIEHRSSPSEFPTIFDEYAAQNPYSSDAFLHHTTHRA